MQHIDVWDLEECKGLMELQNNKKIEKVLSILALLGFIISSLLMYYRAFFGIELTDGAYYVSEAKEILSGNVSFAYNNSSKAVGFTYILIVLEAFYRIFKPDYEGVFLFCKLCFVTYKIICVLILYRILQKNEKKSNALIISTMLIAVDGYMQLFNYNNVPQLSMLLSGSLLYDVLEQGARNRKIENALAGVFAAVGCFANPGWGVAIILFIILIIVRSRNTKDRLANLCWFCGSMFSVVALAVAIISARTSIGELWYGFYRLFINPFPVEPLNPDKMWMDVYFSVKNPIIMLVVITLPVFVLVYIVATIYSRKKVRLNSNQKKEISITFALFIHTIYLCLTHIGDVGIIQLWGFSAFCYMLIFLALGICKEERIIFYLALYPPIFAVVEIILLSNGANIGRFVNAYTVMIPLLYTLLKNKSRTVRTLSLVTAFGITASYIFIDYAFVYRDDSISNLTTKVESGVYKGLYTTPTNAHDLPELEKYINSVIDSGESYAFRDNVPCAYLMAHTGEVCEMSTWDILQYSYHRNTPAVLFDYYRRRDMIPDKIIYIDYGRDENLSIADNEFRYNDWVNTYYSLIDDVELNETFYHVMVYQYDGSFDGDYQWWIDNYSNLMR